MSPFARLRFACSPVVLIAVTLLCGNPAAFAQNSDVNLALHANSHTTAADIGLPSYPGATSYKNPDSDSAFDFGFTVGDSKVRVMVASYMSTDSPTQILAFYRRPLSHYGEVLECDHGKPVGTLKVARGGLTCSSKEKGDMEINGSVDSSNDHELRAGTPHQFRIVGIDESGPKSTRFGLVYVELPNSGSDGKPK
jgi:hypothetical protein